MYVAKSTRADYWARVARSSIPREVGRPDQPDLPQTPPNSQFTSVLATRPTAAHAAVLHPAANIPSYSVAGLTNLASSPAHLSRRRPPDNASSFPANAVTTSAINMTDAQAVIDVLLEGTFANHSAACRRGSIDLVQSPGRLIATGDLHDNPRHLATLISAAGMDQSATEVESGGDVAHLTLHELIHGDNLMSGMDLSYRMLTKAADLKRRFPEHVHTLLANHELAQISGAGIVKDGVRVVEAFNKGVEYVFGSDYDAVTEAINAFVRSMPLALRCRTPRGDILCAHSLPTAMAMGRFDTTILSRELTPYDYEPRTGSAYLMVWGRHYDGGLLEDLVERWGINLFIVGHEKCDDGVMLVPPNAIVLNSDHARGVYLPIDLEHPPRAEDAARDVVAFANTR